MKKVQNLVLFIVVLMVLSMTAGAVPPQPIAAYPFVTNVVSSIGSAVNVPITTLAAMFTAPLGVEVCDIVVDPGYKPLYGDLSWGDVGHTVVKYQVADKWWEKALRCDGFHAVSDRAWYKVVNGGQNCGDSAQSTNGYYTIEFKASGSKDPIATKYPFTPSIDKAIPCAKLCYEELMDIVDGKCIPLADVFMLNYENMAAMFANEPATPNEDLFIETIKYSGGKDGNCWPVVGLNNKGGDFRACYYAGEDCIRFIPEPGRTPEQLATNTPYKFTYTVTNEAGKKASAEVTVTYACQCCDRTFGHKEITVAEGESVYVPFTELFYHPCGSVAPGMTNVYNLVVDTNCILDVDSAPGGWKGQRNGWTEEDQGVAILTKGIITNALAKRGLDYTARMGTPKCCPTAYDYFYIRVDCYTNFVSPANWRSGDETQVRVLITDKYIANSLKSVTNVLKINQYDPSVTDPCEGETGGGITNIICRGQEVPITVCDILKNFKTENCWPALYVASVGPNNKSALGGSVYVQAGSQTNYKRSVIYIAPTNILGTVTDTFVVAVSDLSGPDRASITVQAIVDDCTAATCIVEPVQYATNICSEGQTISITKDMLRGAITNWADLEIACGITNYCVTSILPDVNCNVRGTWRVWKGPLCDEVIDCPVECIQELRYTALPSQFAEPGIDRFRYSIRFVMNGETNYINDLKIKIVVRPVVNPSELVTASNIVTQATQDIADQIIVADIEEQIYKNLKGYAALPVKMALVIGTEKGGKVAVNCVTNVTPGAQSGLIFVDCENCPHGTCAKDGWDPCEDPSDNDDTVTNACVIIYTPPAGFIGVDTVYYVISDGTLASCGGAMNMKTGTITVTVLRNVLAPVAVSDTIKVKDNGTVHWFDLILRDCMSCGSYVNPESILGNDKWPAVVGSVGVENVIEVQIPAGKEPKNGLFRLDSRTGVGTLCSFAYLPTNGLVSDEFMYRLFDSRTGLYSQPTAVRIEVVSPMFVKYNLVDSISQQWVAAALYDGVTKKWDIVQYLYRPVEVEAPIKKMNNWYWFGIWDFQANEWTLGDSIQWNQ